MTLSESIVNITNGIRESVENNEAVDALSLANDLYFLLLRSTIGYKNEEEHIKYTEDNT